ncbi:hypothetical protein Q4555_03930 [Octadecabacter sp. 1_MG-2023]|uniref:hypothetical protein n=1 Tax=unclassified Octadecabacter TaxID=196158 RepID=UPI001C086571|nr:MULTISPECIES: hypothetical protein [unclassified Octadecabacter]MBU2992747.1 hypothetical protein [Octadecabacter sp. B2R22]MDO6733802.1 hypothetical protein [Octadecabacter sp. 1_MG-2023]
MSDEAIEIVQTLHDDGDARVVEIARHPEGHYTYAELHREGDEWNAVDGEVPTFKTEYAAYSAAMRNVDWLLD